MRRSLPGLLVALLLPACELAEVSTPPPEEVLVVEAVLRADAPRQRVLLHRSLAGRVVRGERGARVSVATAEGQEVLFRPASLDACADRLSPRSTDSLHIEASCYLSPPQGGLTVRPGESYELRVLTLGGEQLRGRTTVPGGFQLRSLPDPVRSGSVVACTLPPATNLPLVWSVSEGAWSYLAAMEVTGLRSALAGLGIDAPERLELTGLAISERDTTLVVPSEFGVFEVAEHDRALLTYLQNGFPRGVLVNVTVAAVDRNYVNAVRGGTFNPSGTVRISSVVGDGVGVFGSLVPREFSVFVGERRGVPPCIPE